MGGQRHRRPLPKPVDPPAIARRTIALGQQSGTGRYIGGATPSLPTVMRPAASLPSAFFVAPNITGAPGFRSARSAGANVTIGALGGTTILLLPPLNDRLSSRPDVASTVPLTVPLVIM